MGPWGTRNLILSFDHDPPLTTSYYLPGVSSPLLTPHPSGTPGPPGLPPLHPCPVPAATLCLWLEPGCGLREGWDWVPTPCATLEWDVAAAVPALGWQCYRVLKG